MFLLLLLMFKSYEYQQRRYCLGGDKHLKLSLKSPDFKRVTELEQSENKKQYTAVSTSGPSPLEL